MAEIIGVVLALIILTCLGRVAYIYVIKRQRLDMANERAQLVQSAGRAYRINHRVAKLLWQWSGVFVRKH